MITLIGDKQSCCYCCCCPTKDASFIYVTKIILAWLLTKNLMNWFNVASILNILLLQVVPEFLKQKLTTLNI